MYNSKKWKSWCSLLINDISYNGKLEIDKKNNEHDWTPVKYLNVLY